MESQAYIYSPVAPFCLEINRTDDFDWTLTIPTCDQEVPIDGNAVHVYNEILAIRSEWGYDPNPTRIDTTIHGSSMFIAGDLFTQIKNLDWPGTLVWTEINTDLDGLAFRSHLYKQPFPSRTLAPAFRTLAPEPARASGPSPANRSILQGLTNKLREQIFSYVMRDFSMDDPNTRGAYRRVVIPSSKNPCFNLALANHPRLSHLLAFPGVREEIHEYIFSQCFFDFQKMDSMTDSFDTTQMAVDFFGISRKTYRSVVPRIRVRVMLSDLEQEPAKFLAFMEWFSSSTGNRTVTDIPYDIIRRTAANLDVGPKFIKVPQFSIVGLIGQELTLILVPSAEGALKTAAMKRALQRRTLETTTTDGMKLLEQLIKDPYKAKYAVRSPDNVGRLPVEARIIIWNLFLDDLPKKFDVRRPPVLQYASGRNRHMGIDSQHHAPKPFCVTYHLRDEIMAAYVQRTTFVLSLRGDHSVIDDFFERVGPQHCALIKHVEIVTNLAWDGALWHERLFEAVRSVIEHCERSHATTIDTAKYFVDMKSYAPPISVRRKPLDREWAENPQLASKKRQIAAHELFVLPIHGFHYLSDGKQDSELLRLDVTIKVAVPHTFFPLTQFSAIGKYANLVAAINGALVQTPQDFVGTAFHWKVLLPYQAASGQETRAVGWKGMVRQALNAWT